MVSEGSPASHFPSLAPTFTSSLTFFYEQSLIGVLFSQFTVDNRYKMMITDILEGQFNSINSSATVLDINVSGYKSLDPSNVNTTNLEYSVSMHYAGSHDDYLSIATVINDMFIAYNKAGNFTRALQSQCAVTIVTAHCNISSNIAVLIHLDHSYNSLAPSSLSFRPALADSSAQWYGKTWISIALVVIVGFCSLALSFYCGYKWTDGFESVKKRVQSLKTVVVGIEPTDKYVESDSDDEPINEVYQFIGNDDITDVDDMY